MRVITGVDPENENFVSFELAINGDIIRNAKPIGFFINRLNSYIYDSKTNKIVSQDQNIREFLEKQGFIKKPQ